MRDNIYRSGDSDNLPTVIIEAMASGLPVVATRIAGIPEIVAQNQNGLLVDEQSPDQLALAVGRRQPATAATIWNRIATHGRPDLPVG
jgi:glycosyltransferase involved in cell wall biosynthesis